MKLLGAIIGDIVGSRFEWNNIKSKDFEIFTKECFVTDDTIMTLAIAIALMDSNSDYSDLGEKTIFYMRELGRTYPYMDYGYNFNMWLLSNNPHPYNSYGNGAAMRVSACAIVANSLEEVKKISKIVTEVTHNHPEGIKGAEATAVTIYLAKTGKTKEEIKDCITSNYYNLDFTLDEIRQTYQFDESCQGTVPQAIKAFLESTSFEDAIRNAISLGGDSDTIAAITGSIAAIFYGIPKEIKDRAMSYLDEIQKQILISFTNVYEKN